MIRRKVETGNDITVSNKRKTEDDGFALLEENIKRFRITHTPGEIRLSKDVKAIADMIHVDIESTDDPACLLVNFKDNTYNNMCIPCKFMVKVSKYYPHSSPVVTCLEKHFSGPFLDAHGEIQHTYLQNGWSAIGTLRTVIDIIQSLRPYFVQVNHYESTALNLTPQQNKIPHFDMGQSPNCLSMEL